MISMADGSSEILPDGGFGVSEDDVLIDLDLVFNILDESPDSTETQSSPEEYAHKNLDLGIHNNVQSQDGFEMPQSLHEFNFQSSGPSVLYPLYSPDFTNSISMAPSDSYVSPVKSELVSCEAKNEDSSAITYSMYACSERLTESSPSNKGRNGDRISQPVLQSCSTSIYPGETSSHLVAHESDLNLLQDETGAQFRHMKGEDASCDPWMDNLVWKSEISREMNQASLVISGVPDQANCQIMEMPFTESDVSLTNRQIMEMPFMGLDSSSIASQLGSFISGTQVDANANCKVFVDSAQNYFSSDVIQHNGLGVTIGTECQTESASSVSEFSSPGQSEIKQLNGNSESGIFSFAQDDLVTNVKADFCYYQLGIHGDGTYCSKDESSDGNLMWQSEDVNNTSHRLYPCREMNAVLSTAQFDRNDNRFFIDDVKMSFNGSMDYLPNDQPSHVSSMMPSCINNVEEAKIPQPMGLVSRVSSESTRSNSSDSKSHNDDGSDICILEDISQPPPSKHSSTSGKVITPLQRSSFSVPFHHTGTGILRRGNDERLVFQAALQDLSQAKSEASPPDGVLAVPLLRHQRIALSWMVQKETLSLNCRGGILADDQGLGKTVSMIALILKERPQVVKENVKVMKKEEFETVDLDDDDDVVTEVKEIKQQTDWKNVSNNISVNTNSLVQSKGRPSGGTLIVCPTSVLRQWAEELNVKVTREANLSVLVYHGSNRTKDPCELAKYDVVLTTYSIVSMEVPKQNLGDEDEEERKKQEVDNPFLGPSYGKKRKQPPGSGKKCSKRQKGIDGAMVESNARPLAKVAWFRVVLDEAQSIKNHRTHVARACWGLRAKRRWCLSGTPIQNAIDDLFSYFRFLRCEPYSVYKLFCSEIKAPIQRNPTKGYRKLQAVLKTMMLRRTKGTLLDGNPIINLPPKVIELKKVDFTDEERDFYTRLEADSRAQFRKYAVAGTVKQNYVNILLMLLRLRQACDHPFLVRGWDSSSIGKSSIEMAKKLPREKQLSLLNCLEASLAICGICNDPPEDAVVSVCGHVFCHQCVSEHLSGDDNHCPTTGCRVRLNISSVFSKATFRDLLDHPDQDSFASKTVEANGSNSKGCPYASSKIKAALEVLQSLTRSHNCTATESPVKSSHTNRDTRELSVKNPSNAVKMGEKALVFSQWTGMLDLLEGSLKNTNIQYRRLDGTMSVVARDKAVKDFNTLPEVSVMIMSLKAASLGLNMVAACRVVLLDLWWNPTTEDQAIDRAHRIGQTRQVTVLRLTVRNTVEDRILALQQKKREMVASAFGEDETGGRQTRLTVEDLNYLFMA